MEKLLCRLAAAAGATGSALFGRQLPGAGQAPAGMPGPQAHSVSSSKAGKMWVQAGAYRRGNRLIVCATLVGRYMLSCVMPITSAVSDGEICAVQACCKGRRAATVQAMKGNA